MGDFCLDIKFRKDVAIFQTQGYINNLGGEKIEKRCEDILSEGYRKFIINFNDSPIINSIGISILIGLIDRVKKAEGNVCFTNLTTAHSEVFELMGLTKFASIFHTEEDAVHHALGNTETAGGTNEST